MKIHKLPDLLAFFTSVAALVIVYGLSIVVYDQIPHIEDEITYTWQAKVLARGSILIRTPPCPECFLVPFVIDYQGVRFGKYPLGFPAVLSLGERLGMRSLVNPLLSAFSVWLIYLLVKRLLGPWTGLFATFLTILSPFFLMNSPSLLSHPFSLFLSLAFTHSWLDLTEEKPKINVWLCLATASLSLGLLILTRPLTAVGVALPFMIHGIVLLSRPPRRLFGRLFKPFLVLALAGFLFTSLHFVWQAALTNDPLLNPYTLWWSYDRVGFGPGHGMQTGGYKFIDLLSNLGFNLYVGTLDILGWPGLSWVFLPFGIAAIWRDQRACFVSGIFISLVIVYCFYWIGSWLLGPRYYYEGLPSWILLTAAGIIWIGKNAINAWKKSGKWIFAILTGGILLLVILNIRYYLPIRVLGLHGLYGASRENIKPFTETPVQALAPALTIVSPSSNWIEYGALIDLSSPFYDSPFIFCIDLGEEAARILISAFPDRDVYLYNPNIPYQFTRIEMQPRGSP